MDGMVKEEEGESRKRKNGEGDPSELCEVKLLQSLQHFLRQNFEKNCVEFISL